MANEIYFVELVKYIPVIKMSIIKNFYAYKIKQNKAVFEN